MTSGPQARLIARKAVQDSIRADIWEDNEAFVRELLRDVEAHPLWQHDLAEALLSGGLDRSQLRAIALEFYHAFGKLFPGILLDAMRCAEQLEQRHGVAATCACRFLILLNLQDELGFDSDRGPKGAHAAQQNEMMTALEVSPSERIEYRASDSSIRVQELFEEAATDGASLVPLLAVTEMLSHRFFSAARSGFESSGVKETRYLDTHLEQGENTALDQLHSEDLWCVAAQFAEPGRRAAMRSTLELALRRVEGFLDLLLLLTQQPRASTRDL